jgi:hypothetical protein
MLACTPTEMISSNQNYNFSHFHFFSVSLLPFFFSSFSLFSFPSPFFFAMKTASLGLLEVKVVRAYAGGR